MVPDPGDRSTEPDHDGALPPGVRYPLIVLFAAFVLTGLVVLLHDRGWLPLAGPFVAVIVASTLVYVVMWWRSRRVRRLGDDAVQRLQALAPAIAGERALAPEARPTAASDRSLADAADQVEMALQRFAWGHEQGAGPFVERLAATATTWDADAPLTREVVRLSETVAQLDAVIRRMLSAAARRP